MREAETSIIARAVDTIGALRPKLPYRRTPTGDFDPPTVVIPTDDWDAIVRGKEEWCILTDNALSHGEVGHGEINQPARAFEAVEKYDQFHLYSQQGDRFTPAQMTVPTHIWHELQLLHALHGDLD